MSACRAHLRKEKGGREKRERQTSRSHEAQTAPESSGTEGRSGQRQGRTLEKSVAPSPTVKSDLQAGLGSKVDFSSVLHISCREGGLRT